MAADIFTPEKRSDVMSRVRGKGNAATELRLIYLFREEKITGWRRGVKLFGTPDFVFPKLKLAVFVDGCFWHGCPEHGTVPKTNRVFWENKITRNRQRDAEVNRELRKRGWRVLRLWEHELRKKNLPATLRRIRRATKPRPGHDFPPSAPSVSRTSTPADVRSSRKNIKPQHIALSRLPLAHLA